MGRPGPPRSLCWPCLSRLVGQKKEIDAKIFAFFSLGVVERRERTTVVGCCFRDIPIWNLGNFLLSSSSVSCFLTLEPTSYSLERNRISGGGASQVETKVICVHSPHSNPSVSKLSVSTSAIGKWLRK